MIKIDFHIHTVSTNSDSPFEFDIETLKRYVDEAKLDAIAITNHNKFCLEQYNQIVNVAGIPVYPGIEIDLEGGHLLLIADTNDVEDFEARCIQVTQKIPTAKDSISFDEFKQIFTDFNKYILIPHYKKDPVIPDNIIEQFGKAITAGEVSSPKKFIYCTKDDTQLVPVYFSDSRMSKDLSSIPVRQTYLGCEGATFYEIKNCLGDKGKVSLSRSEGKELFQIFNDGQMLSTGLNVILGGRSSGKSYTLNRINENKNDLGDIKYIKQFSLVERDEKKDAKKFDDLLKQRQSSVSQDYLGPLISVIDDVIKVDINVDDRSISNYIESLVKYAKESARHDAYSKAKLLGEEKFQILDQKGLYDLIASTKNLVSNIEFRNIIESHVKIGVLTNLYVALMEEYSKREIEMEKKKWLNELIDDIKNTLQNITSAPRTIDVDLYQIALNRVKIRKFEQIIKLARLKHKIKNKNLQGYELIAQSGRFDAVGELQEYNRRNISLKETYAEYGNPYAYLQKLRILRDNEGLDSTDLYKLFVKIEYKILNSDGYEVSGGERSELNLLEKIEDTQKHDMLLIDEPESSFDNLFLNKKVNTLIRQIAQTMPVVVVTHNSTVGASINPDYILYTKKEIENDKIVYRIYSGDPASKTLSSTDGKHIKTLDVKMDCLEAGHVAYKERRQMYENLDDSQ